MATTYLSDLINRAKFWQSISTVSDIYVVRAFDEAIRTRRRKMMAPWSLKKGTLRVFDGIYTYPVNGDHDELAYLDTQVGPGGMDYNSRARFTFTSLQQFFEDTDSSRNTMCEIFDSNTRYLGIKYEDFSMPSSNIDNAESITGYAGSGDAGTPVLDQVFYASGSSSVRFPVTLNTNSATFTFTNFSISDSLYQNKYFFVYLYFPSAPTSVTLKFGNDASNYISAAVTTQFAGQAFKAGDWNMLAIDLNTATVTGTIDSSSFDYFAVTVSGVTTGNYYIDSSYIKQWKLLDFWYYSRFNVQSLTASSPDKEYFITAGTSTYTLDDSLVGDTEWSDIILYDGLILLATDKSDVNAVNEVKSRREEAWSQLAKKYPDLVPVITTKRYRFISDYSSLDSI